MLKITFFKKICQIFFWYELYQRVSVKLFSMLLTFEADKPNLKVNGWEGKTVTSFLLYVFQKNLLPLKNVFTEPGFENS